jgi:hypothetical protein
VEVTIVWVSGALSVLPVQPAVHRGRDLPSYPALVARVLALSAEGHQDHEIARRLTGEGFRSARRRDIPPSLVERLRREHGIVSLTEQFRRQDRIEGSWTVGGLARSLGVSAEWLRKRVAAGTVPAQRHPATGRYLIPDDPAVTDRLRTHLAACCR